MNDVLRQRLIGGAVLVAVALLITLILPNARQPTALDDGVRVAEMNIRPLDDGYPGTDRAAPGTSPSRSAALPQTEESYASSAGPQEATALPGNPYAVAPTAAPADLAPASTGTAVPLPPPEADVEPKPRAVVAPAPASVAPAPKPATPAASAATTPKPSTAAVSTAPPKAAAAPAPKPAASAPSKPAASGGGVWRIQAGAYSSVDNARRAQGQIEALGLKAQLAPIESGGQVLYRISSGPYADRAAAEAAARRMTGKGIQTRVYQE